MKKIYLPVLIVLFHLVLLGYLKFTAWPEMTLWPYLITKGWLPYANAAIAHTPLLLVKLAIFYKIFGVGIIQLKIFTWILILLLDGLVYWVAMKLRNTKVAVFSLISFVFWQLFFDGNGLWFDLFMGVFAFISFYFVSKKKYLWAGIFWALAVISKQTAVFFLIPIGLSIIKDIKSAKKLALGIFAVFIPFVLALWLIGILLPFINWAVNFGIFVLPKAQGQVQLPDLKNLIVSAFPFLVFVPLIWKTGRKNINLAVWSIAGALGAYPRFEYFHFQPALPFLAIASGLVFSDIRKLKGIWKLFIVFYLLGSFYLFANFFIRDFQEGTRFYEQDVVDVVNFVRSNSSPNDKIFVMNWWDNIYALSVTLPATNPWVPQLSWYQDIPGIQEKEVSDLETVKPKIIILNPYSESGLSAYIPRKVYNYVTANYRLEEKVDGIDILIQK